MRTGSAAFRLPPLVAAEAPLGDAVAAARRVRERVARSPEVSRPAQVGTARSTLLGTLDDLVCTLGAAHTAARVLPAALGAQSPRRWLVALQTPAEARGTGGLLGGVGVARADRGKVTVTEVETNRIFRNERAVKVPLPPGYAAQWGTWSPTTLAINGGVSPDLPVAAGIWAAKWEASRGERVDGVATMDPLVLGYLLAATGPVRLSDGTQLDAGTAARFVLQDQYARYPDELERDERVRELLDRTLTAVMSPRTDARALVLALVRGAREGRISVAMPGDERVQAILAGQRIGGSLSGPPSPLIAVVVNDAGGSKLGPYITREITYTSAACAKGRQEATLDVRIGNSAPRSGLPAYVTTRADLGGRPGSPTGQRRDYVSVYLPPGSTLGAATLDGTATGMEVRTESGFTVLSLYTTVDPGSQRELTLHANLPAMTAAPTVRTQPLVQPPTVNVHHASCQR
nr:DUF4012 domain-containing protein [Motilibacter deserti]